LRAVVDEVAGARHPQRAFRRVRHGSFLRTKTQFRGVVDLTGGINAFGDDRLRDQTGGDVGLDTQELERQANTTLNRFFSIQIAVRLPGSVSANAPTKAGNGAVWRPQLGERAVLTASGSQLDTRRIGLIAVALVAAVALVLVLRRRVGAPDED
jgi:hypothetical protein